MFVTNPKVSFAIIGAMKAGTTALSEALRGRADVFIPVREEQSFHQHIRTAIRGVVHPRAYEREFSGAPPGAVIGAKCASSIFYPHALQGLWWYNRRIRIIALLRDPADRAYSHWNMNRDKGREARPFEQAVADELARPIGVRHYTTRRGFFESYLARGAYAWQCRWALWRFPRAQILFLKSEDFRAEPEAEWRRVCAFLGVEPDPPPEHWIRHAREYPKAMDPVLRARLTRHFAADIRRMEKLLGWDCADWLASTRPDASPSDG